MTKWPIPTFSWLGLSQKDRYVTLLLLRNVVFIMGIFEDLNMFLYMHTGHLFRPCQYQTGPHYDSRTALILP